MNSVDKRRHYHHDKDRLDNMDGGGRNSANSTSSKYDDPPNSRLFIVCGKNITEDQFREAFGVFGSIEEVWVLKDRVTQEPKGVTYIKFSKTSEAALAMEEMNGRCISTNPRPLKVLIAHSRDQGSRRDMNEDERLVRLFVVVPKSMSEPDLRQHFAQFGDIDYVSIVKDRATKESKGFAYVKYHRMSHAAKAFEGCDRNFKPVFADPKPTKSSYHDGTGGTGSGGGGGGGGGGPVGGSSGGLGPPGSTTSGSTAASVSAYDMLSFMDTAATNPDSHCRLVASVSPSINQDQLWRLFDLVPGLDYCERGRQRGSSPSSNIKGLFTVVYNNPQSAAYAKEKLHGFEYPPGHRMVVKFEAGGEAGRDNPAAQSMSRPQQAANNSRYHQPPLVGANQRPAIQNDLAHLTETIANATALLAAAGYTAGQQQQQHPEHHHHQMAGNANNNASTGETYDPAYCSVKLPPPQPLAAMDSHVAERLFIVCTPIPPQLYALKDVFGRFGNLIDVYMLNGKTCGYAKYAAKASADRAVEALHGQELCGSRLKVMPADPQDKTSSSSSTADQAGRKRPKIDE